MVTVWRDVPVRIRHKISHIKKIGGRIRHAITDDYGDLPVCRINPQTGVWEDVVNHRGMAYAARRRLKYRTTRKELRQNTMPL